MLSSEGWCRTGDISNVYARIHPGDTFSKEIAQVKLIT